MQLHTFLFLSFLVTFQANSLAQGTIALTIDNIATAKGSIMVAVYNSEDTFLSDDQTFTALSEPISQKGELTVRFKDLPYDTYTIAIFHDVNGNGELDTNLFGVPKEPYGFSNNAVSKWGPPKYEVARFDLEEAKLNMQVSVKKWGDQ